MREIKFRAWHPQRRCFSEPREFGLGQSSLFFHGTLSTLEVRASHENLIIQQFTGLKDKNGKEIYEGDVVRAQEILFAGAYIKRADGSIQEFPQCPAQVKTVVAWDETNAGFSPFYWQNGDEWDNEKCEVIGNVHENPELME